MRIGHQIYNYLYDHVDSGRINLIPPVKLTTITGCTLGYIYECYINWKENQVYVGVVQIDSKQHFSIHDFLNWMGGPNPESYKPLYKLRDILRKNLINKKKPS